jgi:hypothetical protein
MADCVRPTLADTIFSLRRTLLNGKTMPEYLTIAGQTREPITQHPDQCPICHHNITPEPLFRRKEHTGIFRAEMEVVYKCPNSRCNELFISYFDGPTTSTTNPLHEAAFRLTSSRPHEATTVEFSQYIRDTSSNFCDNIYNEARKAEQFGLTQICGVGYRKSLEFLIKDYLIRKCPADKATIEDIMLGPCIQNYVTDLKIKEVAKRATWLGNDETHYLRHWVSKDLSDLKTMINLLLHWLEAEHLTEEALTSMPPPSKQ